MDGRWSMCLAGGLLGGLLGCTSPQTRSPGDVQSASTLAKVPKSTPTTQVAAAPAKKPSPNMYVTMGAVAEQVAEDGERAQPERDAARQQARQSYQKAIELDAKHAPAYVALGESYAMTGERDRSAAMFKKAQALAPKDAIIPLKQGACLARAKDWDAAVECFTRATQMDPDNKQAQKFLGLTLTRAGRYDEGLAALTKCMPEAEARYNLAKMLRHNQQGAAAEQQVRQALLADPRYEPALMLLAEFNAGAAADTGIRTASHTEPAPDAPAETARPQLKPVTLGN
jgi:tetratricopeptide (TPR) repeat protein